MSATSCTPLECEAQYPRENGRIHTTLYDLIEAIGDEISAGEDELLAEAVVHLMETGRLKFVGKSTKDGLANPTGS
jgi:hypothetical protein